MRNVFLTLLLTLGATPLAVADWTVDNEQSRLSFVSVKAGTVAAWLRQRTRKDEWNIAFEAQKAVIRVPRTGQEPTTTIEQTSQFQQLEGPSAANGPLRSSSASLSAGFFFISHGVMVNLR